MLRRLSTNRVDRYDDGVYARVFDGAAGPSVATVRQRDATTLELHVDGPPGDEARIVALVRRMLGTERAPAAFERRSKAFPWLHALARRMRGVRAPRYPSLWEAAVNAVVFQQISIHAAAAMLGRTIEALGERRERDGSALFAFPAAPAFLGASDTTLRAAGLSAAKIATLKRFAEAILAGTVDEAMLEERASAQAIELLCTLKGIGPWTATVILLRGLGRLDVFPLNDSGVARAVREFAGGDAASDLAPLLAALGDERGLLYYHLLLARLEARGELAVSSEF